MNILCDKPSLLKEALGEDGKNIHIEYTPPLDIYTQDNKILRTLKGMYFSSSLDFEDEAILSYIKAVAQPAVSKIEPTCHTCYNYNDFDKFCREFIDNEEELRVAYDVETTAAFFLSPKYELAGFSLANTVNEGCYVVLKALDYSNPDKEQILNRLANLLKTHKVLVFNAMHEYLATKICVGVNLEKETKQFDDAYSMALLLKTESFKPDGVFKLKVLCNRLLGTQNWASIIDDYIDIAMQIAKAEKYDFSNGLSNLTDTQRELLISFRDILKEYNYTSREIVNFVTKLQDSYESWSDQDMLPYSLIPCKLIDRYGCFDACYLVALFNYFENWCKELDAKLQDSLSKPNIENAYREMVNMQIMSAILTVNGIFVDKDRDEEVKEKSKILAEERYNNLWKINSDSTGKNILREYVKKKFLPELRKKYILPFVIEDLIPEGFKFISTTPSLYSFECEVKDLSLVIDTGEVDKSNKPIMYLTMDNAVKVYKKTQADPMFYCKLLQKHLLPFETLSNEEKLVDEVTDTFLNDCIKRDGSLSVTAFKPMSGPKELYDILNEDFKKSNFLSRVVLFEHDKLPEKLQSARVTQFLGENPLYKFDDDVKSYITMAKTVKQVVLDYLSKSYSFKQIYEDLVKEGIKSFASPIIAYIYNVYTATGCTVDEPKHSVFDFINQLKICRKYMRINSTFIYGSSGGYSSQMKVDKKSISDSHLIVTDTSVLDHETGEPYYNDETESVVFGKWYAGTAETGRWQATVHNVPAGAYAKRRFVSRFPGGFILANDMSQAEVRELAAVSKCEKLLETIKDPTVDIHRRTASLAFNVPYDEVTSTQRKQTKEGIFSIVYGREEESLAQSLFKGDKASAKRLMDAIFTAYPEIKQYLSDALIDAKRHGYLVTRRGAPLFINPYTSEGGKEKGENGFRRNVQNYGIQSGASYFCSGVLKHVQDMIDKKHLKSKVICYIHDAVYCDVHPDELDEMYKILNYTFNEWATETYNVPTASDTEIGYSMGCAIEIERLGELHYKIDGYNENINKLFKQLEQNYNIEVISNEVEETVNQKDDVDWCFIPRSELKWFDSYTPAKYEIKLTHK